MNYIKNQDEKIKLYEANINDVVPKNQHNAMKAQYEAKIEMLENKLAGHEEFKKNAENVCESYAVTESLMKQIEERDTELRLCKTEIKGMEKAFEDIAEELEIDKDDEFLGHYVTSIEKIRADKEKYFELKYSGDDWGWVYGKMCVDTDEEYKEVVLCMAGGGDHWENYIMTPTMNYIENTRGRHPQQGKMLIQSDCGNYVSFQDEEDYDCEGDETTCEYHHCVE